MSDHTPTARRQPYVFPDLRLGELDRESGGALCDVAPTILHLLALEQPSEMTGRALHAT